MPTETRAPNPRYTDYNAWGWLYNETMGPKYCQSQLQPLESLLLPALPAGAALLDVCCGTGHLAQKLDQKGFQIIGIDGSDAMLSYARQNVPRADFLLADARQFEISTQFDAAFSTSASLNHMLQRTDLQNVFQNVFSTLKPGGLFLFDLNHPEQMQKWWTGNVAEGEIVDHYAWSITPVYDPRDRSGYFQVTLYQGSCNPLPLLSFNRIGRFFRQLVYRALSPDFRRLKRWRYHILSRFHQWEPDWRCSEQRYAVRGYEIAEVQDLLAAVGFDLIKICTLDGHTPLDADHSAYFLCRKPTSMNHG
jgi:SAM-dependent methyltransferase